LKEIESQSLGICIGASTVSAVWLSIFMSSIQITRTKYIPHHGNPKSVLLDLLDIDKIPNITITGRRFRSIVNLTSISEPEAIELTYDYLNCDADIIISIGGENFIVYEIDTHGKISKPYTGNKCASGTGEFFLQQIKRMDLEPEEATSLALEGNLFNISGRCSVFCKSDCTHALNKGVAKADVAAGLTKMMAQKIIELTAKSQKKNALIIGGVSKNRAVVNHLYGSFNNLTIPDEAPYFEALGAALYASKNETIDLDKNSLIPKGKSSFSFHKDLKSFTNKVVFKSIEKNQAIENDEVILGLDVGSTTTKAILLRTNDNSVVASEYLRTNGDPVAASIECYKSIRNQVNVPINIIGLGVTGSGRYISGLHAQTKGIINEIIAHATATVFFDDEVDTIFEIGGQDAKYTYITAGVPSDYAMNEACSAGTGSFLEEAAKESLNIDYRDIGEIALQANRAPNFNDQCSAFISSDIKNALHEGLTKNEIVSGLVYSICLNYTNRVKGNRPLGKKVFMQGGVCYNKAVPIAMAALTGKEIIVPPEPGLMGAFGVAFEIKNRIELELIEKKSFDLEQLINRKVEYEKSFTCAGTSEKCDRKCSISLIKINDKNYPFGGACNKYYNLQSNSKKKLNGSNLVHLRQELVFEKYIHPLELPEDAKTIGIPKSFLTNSYYPLYYNFFTQLGFKVILGDTAQETGIDQKQAAFCYPVELAHGFMQDLINKKPHYIFLPHVLEIHNKNSDFRDRTCILLQAERYYLKTAFKEKLNDIKILSPIFDFANGFESARENFINLAKELNITKPEAWASFDFALNELTEMQKEFKMIGKTALEELEKDKGNYAIVLIGRSYNSCAKEANLGIPQKFSSRHVTIIPHDFLSYDDEKIIDHMYWGTGRQILRAASFVKNHSQLFATYITNFSCGPDSFLIGYFRDVMGKKPSLTLELDSHSADAGLNTRIEAFLDIVKSYRQIDNNGKDDFDKTEFKPLMAINANTLLTSDNKELSIYDKSVKMIIPNMGRYGTEALSAAFRHSGINSAPLSISSFDTLKMGRGNTTCKECLPLILTIGSMMEYYQKIKPQKEKTLFLMVGGDGPCRFGQYSVFMEELIRKKKLTNIGVYTLSDENMYEGLGSAFDKRGYIALLIGDVIQNIFHSIQTIAVDKEKATLLLEDEWSKIVLAIERNDQDKLYEQLESTASNLSEIKRSYNYNEVPKVAVLGEIFVRNDEFSRVDLLYNLYERTIIPKVAPITEYVHYSNYMIEHGLTTQTFSLKEKLKFKIRKHVQLHIEKKIKGILAKTGFCDDEVTDVDGIIKRTEHLINPELVGETILTVGSAFHEILHNVSGVISVGPFGCMPSRIAESILNIEMNVAGKEASEKRNIKVLDKHSQDFPYLAIETDGNLFPQIIQSKIEIFMLQTERLHKQLSKSGMKEKLEQIFKFKRMLESTIKGYYQKQPDALVDDEDEIITEIE
jgi:predicted CoA-substrate-specific enzyme activase